MKRFDLILILAAIFLTLFGLLMIYDASSFVAFRDFADKYHYLKGQFFWALLGFGFLTFFSFFDYHRFYNLSLPLIIVSIVLLVLVFVPGIGVNLLGARRWIDLKIFLLQPTEIVKLSLAIYLAAWFSRKEKGRFVPFVLLMGFLVTLIMLQPDMGTAFVILGEAFVMYFLSGGNMFYVGASVPFMAAVAFILIKIEPYRAARLATFLNPSQDVQTSSYHVKQILIALGNGGVFGVGLGNSLQKYAYLPENTTDSIFAIIAEELGFVGSTALICIMAVVIWRGFIIAAKAPDSFGRLLAAGVTTFLAIQMIINLGAQTILLPLTGIPLPFISYGGSALIVNLCAVGILLNIGRQSRS